MLDMTDLSIIVFHNNFIAAKKADKQSAAGKLGVLIQFTEGVGYEICQYRNGAVIEKKGQITSIGQTLFTSLDELHAFIEVHLEVLAYDIKNIFLAVEGNLGEPGLESITDNCTNFVAKFNSPNVAIFSTTIECLEKATEFFEKAQFKHMDVGTVKTDGLAEYMVAQYGGFPKAPPAEAKQAEVNKAAAEEPSLPALSFPAPSRASASHTLFAVASALVTARAASAAEEPPLKPGGESFLAPVPQKPGKFPPIPQASSRASPPASPLTLTSPSSSQTLASRASSQTLSVSPLSSFGASEPDEAEQDQLSTQLKEVTAALEMLESDGTSLSFS
jgi:hypothetical protein